MAAARPRVSTPRSRSARPAAGGGARSQARGGARGVLLATAAVLLGAVIGTGLAVLGERLLPAGPLIAPLTRTFAVGVDPPVSVDLGVATLTLGLTVRLGVLTLLGAAGAGYAWHRSRA